MTSFHSGGQKSVSALEGKNQPVMLAKCKHEFYSSEPPSLFYSSQTLGSDFILCILDRTAPPPPLAVLIVSRLHSNGLAVC